MGLKFINGDRVEVVLVPSEAEVKKAIEAVGELMRIKINDYILDQLTSDQLKNCIRQFQAELRKRESE